MQLLILPQKGHDSVASLIIPCTSKQGLELGSTPNLSLQPHQRKLFRRSVEQTAHTRYDLSEHSNKSTNYSMNPENHSNRDHSIMLRDLNESPLN